MPAAEHTLDQRQRLIVLGVMTLVLLLVGLLGGAIAYGALPRTYRQIGGDEATPATTTSLGRAVSAMHDLHYFCTEGTSTRQGVRFFACSGPEGRAEIEGTTAGKVTYLALVGRAGEMTDERAKAVGRALVNGAELNQDAKLAARAITDGRAQDSKGPWGTATAGPPPYRLVFEGSDRVKLDKPATLGAAGTLASRLAKQSSCRTADKATASPSASGGQSASQTPGATAPPPAGAAATVTTCTSSSRLVTTTVSFERSGDQVSRLSVRSSGLFAYGWTHTEAIAALRAALSDLGQNPDAAGNWAAANSDRQGTAAVGSLLVELNSEAARAVTSVTVTRIP